MINSDKDRETARLWQLNLRQRVLAHLGGTCIRCGFSDARALQVDHVNGGGMRQRSTVGHTWITRYKDVLASVPGERYQLLCANCNWIKRAEKNENATRATRITLQQQPTTV